MIFILDEDRQQTYKSLIAYIDDDYNRDTVPAFFFGMTGGNERLDDIEYI